ncbi:MAG: type II toxin-antitoxin system MqsA family antitoxin [Candidatus Contendobacter sp.]|nr:type II toxin-antitoxin system MqsA family antitoxin [Candidatus Contendobacter sp.]
MSSPSTSPHELCANCGYEGVQLRKVTRSFGRGSSLLVIEDIPMWSCPHCGTSYFAAQTMHEIERIKMLRKSVAVDRSVSVATFIGPVPNCVPSQVPHTQSK